MERILCAIEHARRPPRCLNRSVAVTSPVQLRDELVRLVHRGPDVRDLTLGASRILSRSVPFEGVCLLTMDPGSLLPTGEVVENGLPPEAYARMAEIEQGGEDVNAFRALAHSDCGAASLGTATRGQLERSRRHREVRRPHGFGDELRAVLRSDSRTWGAITLLRGEDGSHFAPGDSATVASVSAVLAEGLRRATLLAGDPRAEGPGSAGLAVLAPDNSVVTADAAAEGWLAELRETGAGAPLPPVVSAVASRARSIVAGEPEGSALARARIRAPSGRWLLVRASALGDEPGAQIAVILEPAPAQEVAPLLADAYDLSERERAVTRLVARGLPTNAIAARLHISSWTVQDHLKAIFEKVGVTSRGELVARLFFEPDAPRLSEGG